MRNKNRFFTFCWACVPGAGEMYQGYMKRGLSLMIIFWGIIMIANLFNFDAILVMLPVVWAYAFFDTFNLRAHAEEGTSEPDDYIVDVSELCDKDWQGFIEKNHTVVSAVLIFLGVYAVYNTLLKNLGWSVNSVLWELMNILPTLAVAALLIVLGIKLMRVEQKEEKEDYKAFCGTAESVYAAIEPETKEQDTEKSTKSENDETDDEW